MSSSLTRTGHPPPFLDEVVKPPSDEREPDLHQDQQRDHVAGHLVVVGDLRMPHAAPSSTTRACPLAMMMHRDHHTVRLILARLAASSAKQVKLEEIRRLLPNVRLYLASCGEKWTYVDRPLARRLRAYGAVWSGDLLRDPCAVA